MVRLWSAPAFRCDGGVCANILDRADRRRLPAGVAGRYRTGAVGVGRWASSSGGVHWAGRKAAQPPTGRIDNLRRLMQPTQTKCRCSTIRQRSFTIRVPRRPAIVPPSVATHAPPTHSRPACALAVHGGSPINRTRSRDFDRLNSPVFRPEPSCRSTRGGSDGGRPAEPGL